MVADTLAKREPIITLLTTLNTKFTNNLNTPDQEVVKLVEIIDTKSRAIDGASEELRRTCSGSQQHRIECTRLLLEIFADLCQAMYLLAIGLIVPARMLTRRALELGIATVYLWDLPHEYWTWSEHDGDLSFSKMVDHLSSPGYLSYIAHVQGKSNPEWPFAPTSLQSLYRTLSNTVHGKADGLPPLSPERYSARFKNIGEHLTLVLEVQTILLNLWCARFDPVRTHILKDYPKALRKAQ